MMKKIEGLNFLVDQADIKYVAESLGIEIIHRGSSYFCLCPLPEHQDEHATNCFFKDGDNYMHCMVCHKNVDAIDLIRYTTNCSFYQAVKTLWNMSGCPDYVKFCQEKEEYHYLPLDAKTLRFLNLSLPAYIAVPIGIDEYNKNVDTKKEKYSYMKNSLDYIRCDRVKVNWHDFISPTELAQLLITKAKDKLDVICGILSSTNDPYDYTLLNRDGNTALKIISDCQAFLQN